MSTMCCFTYIDAICTRSETYGFMNALAYLWSEDKIKSLTKEYALEIIENYNKGKLTIHDDFNINIYAACIRKNQLLARQEEAKKNADFDENDFNTKTYTCPFYTEERFNDIEAEYDVACNWRRFLSIRADLLQDENVDVLELLRESYKEFSVLFPCTKLTKLIKKHKELREVLYELLSSGYPLQKMFPELKEEV